MILHVDRAWLLETAHQHLGADPDVTDFGALAAAVARHADEVMDVPVYAEPWHRAAALMHLLIRVPALEFRNEAFGAVVAAAYLSACGLPVTVAPKDAVALATRVQAGLGVRDLAAEIRRDWISA
ncbi:fic family toxin-antitoxin system, toxin component [Streptomyces sp. VN1]|uniref:fic family toxin-antitoxin system, toxin component n=1 Tax=Streptomyces sp. VN1 TaxID=1821625 RepID=UPI001413A6D4|nr:fic family toxin-antitoxin system, toxin component [Streptomyces sp. VN1]QIP74710.1 fic family toxin-antitoxin system, toxin component [Streptomyces sp. VN1]